MQTNQLQRIHPNRTRMIVARGGKRGKTSGRGGKGQSARAGNKRRPEWRDIIKRVPKLRGRGKSSNKSIQVIGAVVNLDVIEGVFAANDAVNPATLIERGIISTISGRVPGVKILGEGEITKAVKISGCFVSESATMKVKKAGGSVEPMSSRVLVKALTEAQTARAARPKKVKKPQDPKAQPQKEVAPKDKAEKSAVKTHKKEEVSPKSKKPASETDGKTKTKGEKKAA